MDDNGLKKLKRNILNKGLGKVIGNGPEKKSGQERRRGIYLLPNLLTTASLFAAFFSLIACSEKNYIAAAIAILVSVFFDGLDGRVARMTGTSSQFGVEYDSLSDLVAFGVAPSFLAYNWALEPFGRLGWVICFVFLTCGALRLARFNSTKSKQNPRFFQGLAIPAAAGMISATVFFFDYLSIESAFKGWLILPLVMSLSFLMVSNLRYPSFKGELLSRKPFNTLVLAILVIALVTVRPQIMLFAFGLLYITSGIVISIFFTSAEEEIEVEIEDAALEAE